MTPAERLLAMADDEAALETLPAGELQADLALLGIDPAPSIAFAKALASGRDTPGGRLLGGIGAAEDAEDEIARIEAADIDEVRAAIPGGSTAAIAAEARRKAGGASNVVGIQRRRRSRLLVWGAPITGIAASLLVVVVGYEVVTVNYPGVLQEAQYAAAPEAVESESARSDELSQLRELRPEPMLEPSAPEIDALSDSAGASSPARAGPERRQAAAPPPAVALGNEYSPVPADDIESLESGDADDGFYRAAPKPRKKSVDSAGQRSREIKQAPVGEPAESGRAEEGLLAKSFADKTGSSPSVVAVLVVDADRAPLSIQSKNLPAGRLADRLDEAWQAAAGRDVIALIALDTPIGQADFVQVPLSLGMAQQLPPPAPLAGLLGADAMAYDFIALPPP